MKIQHLLYLCLLFVANICFGQQLVALPYDCEYESNPPSTSFTLNPICTQSTLNYIPDENTTTKTIKVAIHYMQRATGTPLNWTENGDGLGNPGFTGNNFAELVIFYANSQLGNNGQMNLPIGNNTPVLDRKYNYKLVNVYYHQTDFDYTYNSNSGGALNSAYGSPDVLDIFFLYNDVSSIGGGSSGFFAGWVKQQGTWQHYEEYVVNQNILTIDDIAWGSAGNINHEIGHFLSLHHTVRFNNGPCGNINDLCSDTPSRQDLLNAGQPDPCCGHGMGNVSHCSNNMMDYSGDLVVTPEQLGRIHYALMNPLKDYIYEDYCEIQGSSTIPAGANLIWENTEFIYGDLILEAGAQLTIKCLVHMPENAKIIVKPGAKLTIDGGVISNSCGDHWQGIEVWGHSDESQFSNLQGEVLLINGAIIEHAEIGIALWEPGNWASTGGYVRSYNSFFLNNRKDVEFLKYSNDHLGYHYPNKSLFTNTEFSWDDDFRSSQPLAHVTLYGVDGIPFSGCTFNDDRTLVQPDPNARGILSIDANYIVEGRCTNFTGCPGDIDDSNSGWDPTIFENLHLGISAFSGAGNQTINVDRCIFRDNHIGLNMVSLSGAVAIRNKFEYTNDPSHIYTSSYMYGIHLMNSDHFTIEENEFDGAMNSGAQIFGISCSDNGEQPEEVYNNEFNSMTIGNFAQGVNRNSSGNGNIGLEFRCNFNTNNLYDHLVSDVYGNVFSADNGVDGLIGSITVPGGNKFTSATFPALTAFNNLPANAVIYWSFSGDGSTAHNISMPTTTSNNQCLSNLSPTSGWGTLSAQDRVNVITEFNDLTNQITIKETEYNDNLIDDSEYGIIMASIDNLKPNNKQEVRDLLDSYSPYLTTEILFAIADNTPSDYNHPWLKNLMIDNIEAVTPELLDFLATKDFPLPSPMRQEIANAMDNGYTDKLILESEISYLKAQKSIYGNMLIQDYLHDSTGFDEDSLIWWIQAENDLLYQENVIDIYLQIEDFTSAELQLNSLEASIPSYSLRVQDEIKDFISLKRWQIDFLKDPASLGSIKDPTFLRSMAKNGVGTARYQAENILCFFFNECFEYQFEAPIAGRASLSTRNQNSEKLNIEPLIGIYPNPANNWVMIEFAPDLIENYQDLIITMTDVTGKVINQTQLNRNSYLWETANVAEGLYIITISSNNQRLVCEKVIIRH